MTLSEHLSAYHFDFHVMNPSKNFEAHFLETICILEAQGKYSRARDTAEIH